jgi:hypothetical protein
VLVSCRPLRGDRMQWRAVLRHASYGGKACPALQLTDKNASAIVPCTKAELRDLIMRRGCERQTKPPTPAPLPVCSTEARKCTVCATCCKGLWESSVDLCHACNANYCSVPASLPTTLPTAGPTHNTADGVDLDAALNAPSIPMAQHHWWRSHRRNRTIWVSNPRLIRRKRTKTEGALPFFGDEGDEGRR